MPIFQDDIGVGRGTPPTSAPESLLSGLPLDGKIVTRKVSEESIRTDLCEGPVPDSPDQRTGTPENDLPTIAPSSINSTSNRVELIERLKKGQSPTWLPNRSLGSLLQEYDRTQQKHPANAATSILPAPPTEDSIQPFKPSNDLGCEQVGLQIGRPRSALHSGDFTEGPQNTLQSKNGGEATANSSIYNLRRQRWLSTSPPRDFDPFQLDGGFPSAIGNAIELQARSRAPSLSSSYSASFVMKPPTSPLVQSESNEDLELLSRMNPIDIMPDSRRNPRRHTLQASHSLHSIPSIPNALSFNRPLPHLRRDNSFPYQAHQPRRSLNLNSLHHQPSSSQPHGFVRSRGPSFTSESSPRANASMVGSYEESILRGRMSTTPSKPLDFVAQIGVLGLGKCKSSLRCPPHVIVPFPAVFYSYDTTSHSRGAKNEDGPSPYVGQIDLENNVPHPEDTRDCRKKRHSTIVGRASADDLDMDDIPNVGPTEQDKRRAEKQKRRSTSPRAPPGGCYRIPEKGQLQIIIKNPNKTAVKLFLVPYDLAGMEPGTKTFIRQRSYSAGPIMDPALSSTAQISSTTGDRPTLRYLIHLHICSPSRGRFYLYKSIRVVFANRVPDGKEKLRNEISLPEPKYSIYKPGRDSTIGHGLFSGAGASLAAEKAFRRRSSGFGLSPSNRTYDNMGGISQVLERGLDERFPFENIQSGYAAPVQPIPFGLFRQPKHEETGANEVKPLEIQSPSSSKSSQAQVSPILGGPMSWNSNSTGFGVYDKLHKGDVGYGGNAFNGSPDGKQVVAESLLAKRLRGLGVANDKGGCGESI